MKYNLNISKNKKTKRFKINKVIAQKIFEQINHDEELSFSSLEIEVDEAEESSIFIGFRKHKTNNFEYTIVIY